LFIFQAEDGIRARNVTGVQTCALPISTSPDAASDDALVDEAVAAASSARTTLLFLGLPEHAESEGFDRTTLDLPADQLNLLRRRSEERRVGKEWTAHWATSVDVDLRSR